MPAEVKGDRCARDSDWCDGTTCREFWGLDCANADPVELKSTCEKRPGCGCSVECRDHAARVLGDEDLSLGGGS